MLTDEQYQILLKEEHAFAVLVSDGWIRNLSTHFLNQMNEIYTDALGIGPFNVNCPSCIPGVVNRLWPLMQAKKAELIKREEDRVIAATLKERDEKFKDLKKAK